MKLFVIVEDNCDGSHSANFTLNGHFISFLEQMYQEDRIKWEHGIVDGDGFHYETIEVPDGSTPESLCIEVMDEEYWYTIFKNEED